MNTISAPVHALVAAIALVGLSERPAAAESDAAIERAQALFDEGKALHRAGRIRKGLPQIPRKSAPRSSGRESSESRAVPQADR